MAFFAFKSLEHLRKVKPRLKIEYPRVDNGELFSVQLPSGAQFIRDFEKGVIKAILVLGITGQGKSNVCEVLVEYYIRKGCVVVDFHSVALEGLFWARKYSIIAVYPHCQFLIKSESGNIDIREWSAGFDWRGLFKEVVDRKAILVITCNIPNAEYYMMLAELTEYLLNPLEVTDRVILIRDLAGLMPAGLKESAASELLELKRQMLKLIRYGRKFGNRIIADAQIQEDIIRAFRDNIYTKIFKYYEVDLADIPDEINEEIKQLEKNEAIIHYKGVWFGASFNLSSCHKNEFDKLDELGLTITENVEVENTASGKSGFIAPRINTNIEECTSELVEYYPILRQIAFEEYGKALLGVKKDIIEEIIEYDFPSDPDVISKHWTYKEVKNVLARDKRYDSVGKNIRQHKDKVDNNVKERVGLRFIEYLIKNTPTFPTQKIFFNGGVGCVDLLIDDWVACNIKLFTDWTRRPIHMAPEFSYRVHYGIIVRCKPFNVVVYRGVGEEFLKEGSVWGLNWSSFIKELTEVLNNK